MYVVDRANTAALETLFVLVEAVEDGEQNKLCFCQMNASVCLGFNLSVNVSLNLAFKGAFRMFLFCDPKFQWR